MGSGNSGRCFPETLAGSGDTSVPVGEGGVELRIRLDEPTASDPERLQILRQFVEDGGSLYVTDLAYDYVEQAFPEFIDFFQSDTTPEGDRETIGAAERGIGGITSDAEILDSLMANWLDGVTCVDGSCRNEDGTVHLAGFLTAWALINGAHPASSDAVTIWTRGEVASFDGTGVHPLTVSFTVGQGKVLYSSYHTNNEEPTLGFHPQERILQYLIFEL